MGRKLDATDKKILLALQKSGRISNVDLAKAVNLSTTPCHERIRRLERDGYIEGYYAKLNSLLLNYNLTALVQVTLDRTTNDVFEKFAEAVTNIENIMECHMVGGGFDYLLKIQMKDMIEYKKLLTDKISTLPGIAQTHSFVVIDEIINRNQLPLHHI